MAAVVVDITIPHVSHRAEAGVVELLVTVAHNLRVARAVGEVVSITEQVYPKTALPRTAVEMYEWCGVQ